MNTFFGMYRKPFLLNQDRECIKQEFIGLKFRRISHQVLEKQKSLNTDSNQFANQDVKCLRLYKSILQLLRNRSQS